MKLGQVRGVVLLVAERAALEIHEYSPRLIKQTVVGYGNAEKHQVQEMVRLLLALEECAVAARCGGCVGGGDLPFSSRAV